MNAGFGALGRVCSALLVLVAVACAPLAQRTSLPVEPRPSPNFGERRPGYVILHHSSHASAHSALLTLTNPARQVSAHYLVGRDGTIYYLVDELARAWHAGESYWAGNRDMNSASIGIELDNNGAEPFAEAQIAALLALLADIKARYRIPAANFLGHGDVAPRRKADPSRWFPWKRLAEQGFGVWCDPPYTAPPADLDTAVLLGAFGYDVADVAAAAAAFKRRFLPDDATNEMTDEARAMLYCLLLQKGS